MPYSIFKSLSVKADGQDATAGYRHKGDRSSSCIGSARRLRKRFTRTRRMFTPVLASSPLAASCRMSIIPQWFGEMPSTPKSSKGMLYPKSPKSPFSKSWMSPKSLRFPKSPKKYQRRRSSADIDRELELLLNDSSFLIDGIPGCVSHSEGDVFIDLPEASDPSSSAGPASSSLLPPQSEKYQSSDKEQIPEFGESATTTTTRASSTAISLEQEQAASERLTSKTSADRAELARLTCLGAPATFVTNAARLKDKVEKLKEMQQHLGAPSQRTQTVPSLRSVSSLSLD